MSDLRTVEDLTLRLLDDVITEEEREQLHRLVLEDDEAARLHVRLIEQEAALRGFNRTLDLADATMERLRRAQADRVSASVMDEIRKHRDRQAEPTPEPARASVPFLAGRLGVAVAVAAVVALTATAAVIGYHAATHRQPKGKTQPAPIKNVGQSRQTVARIARIESALKDLQAELRKLAAVEERVLRQASQASGSKANIAQAHAELTRIGRRQENLVRTLKRGTSEASGHIGKARSELKKLDELRERLLGLAAEATEAGKQEILRMLSEIGRKTQALHAAIRLATVAGARRALRMRRPRPRAAFRSMKNRRKAKAYMAADAFGDR